MHHIKGIFSKITTLEYRASASQPFKMLKQTSVVMLYSALFQLIVGCPCQMINNPTGPMMIAPTGMDPYGLGRTIPPCPLPLSVPTCCNSLPNGILPYGGMTNQPNMINPGMEQGYGMNPGIAPGMGQGMIQGYPAYHQQYPIYGGVNGYQPGLGGQQLQGGLGGGYGQAPNVLVPSTSPGTGYAYPPAIPNSPPQQLLASPQPQQNLNENENTNTNININNDVSRGHLHGRGIVGL